VSSIEKAQFSARGIKRYGTFTARCDRNSSSRKSPEKTVFHSRILLLMLGTLLLGLNLLGGWGLLGLLVLLLLMLCTGRSTE
jgi:hypothetical protein